MNKCETSNTCPYAVRAPQRLGPPGTGGYAYAGYCDPRVAGDYSDEPDRARRWNNGDSYHSGQHG